MPAHLSIIQHLLFHLFKLAGKKNHFCSQLKGLGAGGGEWISFAQRPSHSPFFLYIAKKTTILDLHLLNWRDEDPGLHRPQLHCDTVSRKSHFTKTGGGVGGRRGIDSVFCTDVHGQWIVTTLGVGGSRCTQQAWLSSLGVFSLIIGVAFISPANRRSGEGEHQQGAITSPISWPQTKASRQAAPLKMMYFWSKSLELSAAWPSAATWLLLDRFVPLIRADSDCRHCLCKEKMAGRNLPSVMRKLGWGRDFSSGIC